jgi:hypothetical protein
MNTAVAYVRMLPHLQCIKTTAVHCDCRSAMVNFGLHAVYGVIWRHHCWATTAMRDEQAEAQHMGRIRQVSAGISVRVQYDSHQLDDRHF